ncbi:MAG: triple tyrosine motif-containing protein [Ignavibacteriales bacterium]|nr:triple tyrosine motif-containing protein [Ignavibacteriales bacterium]
MDSRIQFRSHFAIPRVVLLALAISLVSPGEALLAQKHPVTPITQYNIRSWSAKDGLPNDKIIAVYQSAQGYIWLASQEGLVRFDGARFEIFDKKNTPVFPHSQITALTEDKDSTLWISTIRGILKYRRGKFEAVPTESTITAYIGNTIFVDRKGDCLVGTRTGLLRVVNGVVSKFEVKGDTSVISVNAICEDRGGDLWIGSGQGLRLLNGVQMSHISEDGVLRNAFVTSLRLGKDQTLWVGTLEGLYFAKPGQSRKFEKIGALKNQTIRSLCEDNDGHLWVGTEQDGLYRYAGGKFEVITTREGLSADYILSLCVDREGNIWAGTFYNGVDEIWRGKFETFSINEGLAGPLVRAISEGRDGTVWIGTESGLSRWKAGEVKSFTTKDGLPHNQIRSVFLDNRDALWLGTRNGLSRFDGKHFKNYFVKDGLSNEYARVVTEDFDGNIWVGYNAQGIDRLKSGKFENMDKEGIPRVGIRVIHRGRNRTMWIGTDQGLIRWRDKKATFYKADAGLPSDLFAIYEDSDNTTWIGTYGDGLFRLKDEKVTRLTTKEGLWDDVVYRILEDDHQNFWMSSNKGVFRVPRQELNDAADNKIVRVASMSYGTADGMRSSECNGNSQPAGIRTKDGRMWFPTTNGVAIINPSEIPSNSVAPEVTIEGLKVDSLSINLEDQVSIGPGYSYLEIHYAGLSYVVPEKMVFEFRLDGFDKGWRHAGSRRVAYYTNVPPGNYVFRVRARNNDGVWSTADVTLPIALKPYFYQTGYFYGFCIIVLIASIFYAYRRRVALLLQREKELKERVNEAVAQIKVLGGLIPICANCKKIRDDKGYWNQLEKYLKEHSEAEFTHGICPECREKLYGQYLKKKGPDQGSQSG